MKSLHRSAFAWSLAVAFPLAVACGSNDNSGLFSEGSGGQMASAGGSLSNRGGSSARGGSSSAGSASANGGASATGNVAGTAQGTSGSSSGVAGNGSAGMSMGGTGGSAGAAGSTSGGSAGASAGMGGASAGSGNAGAGGSSSGAGGMSAGGSAGSSGSGGAGPCPDIAPGNGLACGVPTPDGCYYPGVACTCLTQNNGGGPITTKGKWACLGSREPMCPPDLPMSGDSCMGKAGSACPYSSTDLCICSGDVASKWECSAGNNFTCPMGAPTADTMCDTVAICQYPGGACGCNGAKWVCQGG